MIYYVTGFMFSKNGGQVALIKKLTPAWQNGLLNGIGGKIEKNELPHQSMAREFEEEAGVITQPDDWTLFCVLTRPNNYRVHFFFTFSDKVYSTKTIEQEEIIQLRSDELPRNIIENLRWLIPLALNHSLSFTKPIEIEENA